MKPELASAPDELQFTGERFLPEVGGQIAFEHLHRYYVARHLASGKRVLDVACGEGYGSFIVAAVAASVVGVDIAAEAVQHASERYKTENLRYVEAPAANLPFDDASFDLVISFETIEHHDQHEEMLDEILRVLKSDGALLISSPNKQHYSLDEGYQNPYHVKELFKHEFVALIGNRFKRLETFGQRVIYGSLLVSDRPGQFESLSVDAGRVIRGEAAHSSPALREPWYDVVIASNSELPVLKSSLFEMPVHGMDPARFYGVHLAERIAEADQRINLLEIDLVKAPMSMEESRVQFEALHEGLRSVNAAQVDALRQELGGLHAHQFEALHEGLRGLHAHQLDVVKATSTGLSQLDGNWRQQMQQTGEAMKQSQLELGTIRALQESAMSRLSAMEERQESELRRLQQQNQELLRHNQLSEEENRLLLERDKQTQEQLAAAVTHIDSLDRAMERAVVREQQLREELELMHVRLSHASSALSAIEQSRTWRYSAWLRRVAQLLRGRAQ
jgi:SAM-dependent methyltransferase